MPTVIGFLWPWAINTVSPPPPFFFSLRWSQSYETLASPHLHIYCIGLKSGEWLMWSLPPEFLAAHYYEREGGGCSTSVYFWLKLKRTELWVFPTYILFLQRLIGRGQGFSMLLILASHSLTKAKAEMLVKISISLSLAVHFLETNF